MNILLSLLLSLFLITTGYAQEPVAGGDQIVNLYHPITTTSARHGNANIAFIFGNLIIISGKL